MQVHLENLHVKFVYQGHRVKVKVTGAKMGSQVVCFRLKDNLVWYVKTIFKKNAAKSHYSLVKQVVLFIFISK